VEQYNDLNNLFNFLKSEDIVLTLKQQEKLKIYLEELFRFALSHRIVSRNDINFIVNKHFFSSFYFIKEIKKTISQKDILLDLGSGAGFPGVLLSIFFENNKVVLIDSVRKKTLFLKKIIKELGLFCDVFNMRIEDFNKENHSSFQFVTARALASVEELLKMSSSFKGSGELHTIKGFGFEKEYLPNKNYKISTINISPIWNNYSDYLKNKVYLKIKRNEK